MSSRARLYLHRILRTSLLDPCYILAEPHWQGTEPEDSQLNRRRLHIIWWRRYEPMAWQSSESGRDSTRKVYRQPRATGRWCVYRPYSEGHGIHERVAPARTSQSDGIGQDIHERARPIVAARGLTREAQGHYAPAQQVAEADRLPRRVPSNLALVSGLLWVYTCR